MAKNSNIIYNTMDYDGLGLFTALTDFKKKGLQHNFYIKNKLNQLAQMFKVNGLPDTMPEREIKNMLLTLGFICVTDKDLPGLYAFRANLGGSRNAYYMPRLAIIANPHICINGVIDDEKSYSANLKIDEECIIVRNDSQYQGVIPLCSRYATLLVENDLSIALAEYLTRAQLLMTANDDIEKKSNEVLLKQLVDGELGVMKKNPFTPNPDGTKSIDVLPTSLHTDTLKNLIELEQYLRGSWNIDIGVSAQNNLKHEYISSAETELNDDTLIPNVENMFDNWTDGFAKVNEKYGDKYGFEISVEWNSVWKTRRDRTEQEVTAIEDEVEQLEAETEQIEAETEQIEAETEQVETETEQIEEGGDADGLQTEEGNAGLDDDRSDIREDSGSVSE